MIMQFHSGGSDGQVHAHSTRMEIVIQELRFATRRLQWNDLRWEAIAPLEVAQTPTKFVGANLWVKSDVDWHQVQPERRGLFTGPRAKTRLAWVYRCTALLVAILSAFAMAHAIKHKSTKERNHYGG
jgi:hypothetical protein